MDAWQVSLMALTTATLSFIILFLVFALAALEIKDRRWFRQEIGRLDGVVRELFDGQGELRAWEWRDQVPPSKGGHVWESWLGFLDELATLPDEAMSLLVQTARCCNLRTLGSSGDPQICTRCWHEKSCPFLAPHVEATPVPCEGGKLWGELPSPVGEDEEDEAEDEALEESVANYEN